MYSNSNYGPYNSPPAELSNNPFLEHTSNPLMRYPDVTSPNSQFTSWVGRTNDVPRQQGYDTYNPQPVQQQQQQQYSTGWGGPPTYQVQASGFIQPQQTSGALFQPSSSFGQQLSSAFDAGGFLHSGQGYQQQPQQQFTPGYGAQNWYTPAGSMPGQIQNPAATPDPRYLSEFDPYANIGEGTWGGQEQHQSRRLTEGGTLDSQTNPHPRDVIKKHREDLEKWDTYSWKQLMNSLDSLKRAWEKRTIELNARAKQLSTNWSVAAQHELAQYKNVRPLARISFAVD